MHDAEMLAAVTRLPPTKASMKRGEDEVIPFEIGERRLAGESTVKIWREQATASPILIPSGQTVVVLRPGAVKTDNLK
jgi:hypothetical protein